ncbi:regulatory TetR family protein [Actinokineospora auranticolor]|uniref:Regulatory TetR family protein n=2 Tax=Actinokineospora auranticolor TaxID=155976 RepID=A0A2S6GLK5_9PSEU|nr:regulatory TetR family protein [Actinokineospora auranticolor]
MIVRTALPLVAEHGAAVTTAQVARAAGIGEATVFRVFADKEELLSACVAEALRTDHVLGEIAAIPLEQPLAERLVEVASAMEAYLGRMGRVLGALHASGHRGAGGGRAEVLMTRLRGAAGGPGAPARSDADSSDSGPAMSDREAAQRRTSAAVAELFEPERDSLRLPPETLATIFLAMLFSRTRSAGDDLSPTVEQFVDVFLHGALGGQPR